MKKLLFAATIILGQFVCAQGTLESDSLALLDFYHSLNGSNWNQPWNLDDNVEDWSYVHLDNGRVSRIDIPFGENLKGDIPASISNLDQLTVLAIREAELYEPFPSNLCGMTELRAIVFDNTYLYGSIPDCIGDLLNLQGFNVPRNLMTGHIPNSFYSLSNLTDVDLSINKFTGPISEDIGQLTAMQSLKLGGNDFYGFLPESIGDMSDLVWFTFGDNRFEGLVPTSITENPKLVSMEANDNRLSGFESDFLSYDQRIITIGKNFIQEMPDVTDLVENGVLERLEGFDNPLGFDDMLLNNQYFEIRNPTHFVKHRYVSAEVGETISLLATEIHPSNRYSWYKGEDLLSSSTDPGYSIANFDSEDAGEYKCYITNSEITNYEFVEHFHLNHNALTVKIFDNTGEISTQDTLYLAPDFENSVASFRPRSVQDSSFRLLYDPIESGWISNEIVGSASFNYIVSRGSWITQEVNERMEEVVRSFDPDSGVSELTLNITNWYDLRPLPPSNLSISVNGTDVSLGWNAPAGLIDGYLIYRDDELISTQSSIGFTDNDIPTAKKLSYTVYSYQDSHFSDPISVEFSSPNWGEQINVLLFIGDELMSGLGSNNGSYSTPRSDVLIVDQTNDNSGDLQPGWGLTSDQSGIELALGNRLGDVSENPIAIVKVTLENSHDVADWMSPTKAAELGTSVGEGYQNALSTIQEYLNASAYNDYPFANPKLSGVVWLHRYGEESEAEYLEHVSSIITDLQAELGNPGVYLVEPGHDGSTADSGKSAHLETIAALDANRFFIPTSDIIDKYSGSAVEYFHNDLDAFNEVSLSLLDELFYNIDLTATPNDHLVSFCVNDQSTHQFEDYISGRHFNVALLLGHDSLVSDYAMSEYVKYYDIVYEYYWDLFNWGYLGEEQAQQAHVMLAGGGGAGLGGVCAATGDLGYDISEDFGAFNGNFQTALSSYNGASGTIIHELIHAFDARGDLFIPSRDQAHSLTAGFEPLAYAKIGVGMPITSNSYLNPLFTLRFHERMQLDRFLTKDELLWEDIFGDDAMDAVENGTFIMPRHKEHMLINGGILLSMYEMHEEEHGDLMNGIYEYAKDQDGGSLSNEERVDNWVRGAATALNLDVSDYFDYWKYPISDETRTWLSSFPASPKVQDNDMDGFSMLEGDYDDDDDTIYPEASEALDGKDNNLNGLIDEEVVDDESGDISGVSASLPFVIIGDAVDEADVDEVTFTINEESLVTFVIWWKDGHFTKPVANRSFSTEVFQGSVKLNGDNIIWPMQEWHSTPAYYSSQDLEPGSYTVSVQPEALGDYPANPGEYELYVFVNDFKPEPFHYNGLVYQPKVLYGFEADQNWDPSQALGVSEMEANALKTLYAENGGEAWAEDGWMGSYEVPYWKNVHVGKDGVLYLKADLSKQGNMVLPAELADLKNVYRVDFGDQEVCGGQAVIDWLDKIPVVETPYSYCEEGDETVKVFVLAGQSNMQGYGTIEGSGTPGTLDYILSNSQFEDFPLEKFDEDYSTLDDSYIYFDRETELIKGPISVGQGASEEFIGPELMFAHELDDTFDEPVLIIKTAWGGKSLAVDFRPPSAGGTTGTYYTEIINTVNSVTTNLSSEFPQLVTSKFEIAGVGWFQGFNDGETEEYLNEYASNLQHLIDDVRTEFNSPDLPFVIANTGQGGYELVQDSWIQGLQTVLVPAQKSVACDRDYDGTVGYVDTRGYYYDVANSPADAGHHFHNNALTYLNIGQQMGQKMIEAISEEAYCPRDAQTITFELADEILATTGTFELSATSDSGLDIYFESSDESILSINGSEATILSAGVMTISALQDGDDFYEPTSAQQEVTFIKEDQTVSFFLEKTTGFSIAEEFNLEASSTSGLAVDFTSEDDAVVLITNNLARITGSGTANIVASQAGDALYNPAEPISIQITVEEDAKVLGMGSREDFIPFPNPSNGWITIKTTDTDVDWVEVRSLEGKLIMTEQITQWDDTKLDLRMLETGTYILTTSDGRSLKISVK